MVILKRNIRNVTHRTAVVVFSLLLLVNIAFAGILSLGKTAQAASDNPVVEISGTKNYSYAFQVLDIVNEERAANGLSPLTLDKNMTEQAMERAAQVTLLFEHQFPSGGSLLETLMGEYPSAYGYTAGENIALNQASPSAVMTSWMNSDGHRANILNSSFTTIGIGYFEGGWVQLFGGGTATTFSQPSNKSASYSIEIDESVCPINLVLSSSASVTLDKGESVTRTVKMKNSAIASKQMVINNATWKSSNTAVATVSNGKVTAVGTGSATITVTVGSKSLSFNVVVPVRPTAVNISKTEMTLNFGKVDQLTATVVPSGTGIGITWTSSDTSVAVVSSEGYVTANGIGTCTITASAGSYASASCTVTVLSPATAVEIGDSKLTLDKGNTKQLSAVLTPSNSTDGITWTSSNPSVASVDNNGFITALSTGSATITATADSGKSDSVAVTVVSRCTDIEIVEDSISLKLAGDKYTIDALLAPADCTDPISWTIESPIATITPNGKTCVITPYTLGTTTLTVTCGNYSDTVTVVVFNAVSNIELPGTSSVLKGGKLRLTPVVTPSGADSPMSWTSSDNSVLTVDNNGVVTGLSVGSATVSVTADDVTAQCVVTVYEPANVATGITLSDEAVSVKKASEYSLGYTFTPAGSEAVVTWTSSDESVATVDFDGTVKAISDGEAVITASVNGASDSCTVTVYTPIIYAEDISFTYSAAELNLGVVCDLLYAPGYSVAPIDSNEKITWSSSDPSIVSVEDGVVTTKGCGTAVITASARDCSDTITITVINPCTGITLTPASSTILNSESVTINANVTPAGTTDEIVWSSSNDDAFSLTSADGKSAVFTANKRGTYTVTATCGEYSAKCTVTVESNPALDPGTPTASLEILGYATLKLNWTEEDNCEGYEVKYTTTPAGAWTQTADIDSSNVLSFRYSGVTFNKTYYFMVRGYKLGADGEKIYGEWSETVSGKPVPVLSGLKASNTSYNSVTVSWTKNSTSNGYYVYRSSDNGVTWKLLKTITKNSTVSYKNTSLTPGYTYMYKVIPFRKAGSSKIKGIENVVTVTVTPPRPSSLSVSVTSSKPKLTWTKVSGAQGYEIYRSDSYDGEFICIATITSGSTVTWTDVKTASNLYYKVRAYRGTDYGTAYSPFTSVVTATTSLGKPTAFAASASYSSIKVSWHKVTGAAGYKIYRSTDGENFSLAKTITKNTTLSWTNTGLTTGREYYYYVVPYTSSMSGTSSDVISAVPALSKPTLTIAAPGYYLNLSWTKVSGATGYNIYKSVDGENFDLCKTITSGATVKWSDTSVVKGRHYFYKVAAVRSGLEGTASAVKNSSPSLPAPTKPKAARASAESIKISWVKSSGATGYEIFRSTSSGGTYESIAFVSGNSTVTYTDSGLESHKTYYYKVRAVRTLSGHTAYSSNTSYVSAKTSLYAPGNFKAAVAGYNSIKISWNAASCADGYILYRSTSKSSGYKAIAELDGDTLSYVDSGLTTNKYYYYKIKTVHHNPSGTVYSSLSGYKSAKTQLRTPSNVSIDYSPEYIGIYWTTDGEPTGFQFYRSTKKTSGYTKQCSYSESAFEDYTPGDDIYYNTPYKYENVRFIYFSNVSAGKTYYYKIRGFRYTGSTTYYSSYTAYKTAKTIVQTPSIKAIATNNDGTCVMSFADPVAAHDFLIYRATSSKGTYTNITSQCEWYYDEENGINYIVAPTPTDGKRYYFKIRAVNYGYSKTYYSSYSAVKSVVA